MYLEQATIKYKNMCKSLLIIYLYSINNKFILVIKQSFIY